MNKTIISLALMGLVSIAYAKVEVSNCVIQEVIPPKNMTGAFMTIDNQSEESVEIVSAELPSITNTVELHEMKVENNVMSMQEIKSYELTPGVHEFKKGGYHIMLMDIDHKPQVGEQHTLTLNLSNGESVSCQADVLSVDEVMARYKGNQNLGQQNRTPWQIHMARHHSLEEMNAHHQSGVMPGARNGQPTTERN